MFELWWFWEYYNSQDKEIKASLEQEIIGGDWLYRRSAKEQVEILSGAPREFIEKVSNKLKPEAQISFGFNPFVRR